jgi:hypothetical protein
MKILVACEFSGVVRDAFINRGHDAWSCDILPTDIRPERHITGDVLEVIDDGWDMLLAFPPCTHLSGSGCRWATDHWVKKKSHPDGRYWHDGSKKREQRKAGAAFFMAMINAPITKIAVENPIGIMSTQYRKPDQIIQPWQFGHGETKATCLWLKGLPLLVPTDIVEGREQRIWKMAPSETRARERSKTYQGIANAMAQRWGCSEL